MVYSGLLLHEDFFNLENSFVSCQLETKVTEISWNNQWQLTLMSEYNNTHTKNWQIMGFLLASLGSKRLRSAAQRRGIMLAGELNTRGIVQGSVKSPCSIGSSPNTRYLINPEFTQQPQGQLVTPPIRSANHRRQQRVLLSTTILGGPYTAPVPAEDFPQQN